jgi:2-keto-3-deoxy-L-rhamnonate aldolase RhmA
VTPAPRTLQERIDAHGIAVCLCLTQARTVDYPIMAGAIGFDAIYVDLEHTATSLETTSMLCAAAIGADVFPMVRVPSHDHQYLTRVIDTGAMGVIAPHVDTRKQAELLVEACRFPPVGHRSIVGPNPATGYAALSQADTVELLERQTVVCAMVETPEAIEHVGEIASVPGLDMVLVGPHDLTAEMGILGRFRDPRFLDAVTETARACSAHGKILGIAGIAELDLLSDFVGLGVRFVSAGTDTGFFTQAARARVAELRSLRDIP